MVGTIARIALAALAVAGTCLSATAQQTASVTISVKNHRFQPTEIHAPANVPFELRVKNLDSAPMEFESCQLARGKGSDRKRRGRHSAQAACSRPLRVF